MWKPDGTPLPGRYGGLARTPLAGAALRFCHPEEEEYAAALRRMLREGLSGDFSVRGWLSTPLEPQAGADHHPYRDWRPDTIPYAQIQEWLECCSYSQYQWFEKVFCVRR